MVSTRSQTAKTHVEDYAIKSSTPKTKSRQSTTQKSPPKANISKKRKSIEATYTGTPGEKRTKTTSPDSKIIINRAPVLHLWSACIAHATYPNLSWETCLSAGSAVSTICAVAKGRAIGTVSEKDTSGGKEVKRIKAKNEHPDTIRIMHFNLQLKDGLTLVGSDDKAQPGGEDSLKRKFGEDEYEVVKEVFGEVLEGWEGDEEELNQRAWEFYEAFRPEVGKGQKGWGSKGELDLGKVKEVVAR